MCQKVIASSYFTCVTADSLSEFYGKVKEAEKKSNQKAKLFSAVVQFVKYEYISDDDPETAMPETADAAVKESKMK